MSSIGLPGILLLVILALLLFGPKKLPELGRAIGRTFKEFKEGAQGIVNDVDAQHARTDATSTPSESKAAEVITQAAPAKNESNQRLPE